MEMPTNQPLDLSEGTNQGTESIAFNATFQPGYNAIALCHLGNIINGVTMFIFSHRVPPISSVYLHDRLRGLNRKAETWVHTASWMGGTRPDFRPPSRATNWCF